MQPQPISNNQSNINKPLFTKKGDIQKHGTRRISSRFQHALLLCH